ncbi:hypothetical protein [Rhizobium beringeri]|uniref:hypothetical protein n=1 Tax=Rhizobium beringeri TaxID=3019934 RepID=UPI002E14D9D3|nr:hypothetical protein U8P75_23915 [Rhizobium beringeri]WSH80184.1 hypothetical protein U8P69_23745 [Rhizobium beringeri]
MFQAQSKHPRYRDLSEVEEQVRKLAIATLTIIPNSIRRDGKHRKIDMACSACAKTYTLYVDNLLSCKTKGCRCQQRLGKYRDPRSASLGQRYDAIVQRCERDTHVSSHNYKGRGIRNLLGSREAFVRWALAMFPRTDFKGLDFDRQNNDGDYTYENLQVVPRSINLRNRRNSINPPTKEEASDFLLRVRKRVRPS